MILGLSLRRTSEQPPGREERELSLGRRNSVGKDGEDERHGFLGARKASGLKLGLGYHGAGRGSRERGQEGSRGWGPSRTWPC